jgi:hypothetical protein
MMAISKSRWSISGLPWDSIQAKRWIKYLGPLTTLHPRFWSLNIMKNAMFGVLESSSLYSWVVNLLSVEKTIKRFLIMSAQAYTPCQGTSGR